MHTNLARRRRRALGDSRSKLPKVVVGMFVGELTDLLSRHSAEEIVDEVRIRVVFVLFNQGRPLPSFGGDISRCFLDLNSLVVGMFRASGLSSFVMPLRAILPNTRPMNACL